MSPALPLIDSPDGPWSLGKKSYCGHGAVPWVRVVRPVSGHSCRPHTLFWLEGPQSLVQAADTLGFKDLICRLDLILLPVSWDWLGPRRESFVWGADCIPAPLPWEEPSGPAGS